MSRHRHPHTVLCALGALLAAAAAHAGEATAHEPGFADRGLWPAHLAKAAFMQETWPRTRVLVWAHPGSTARGIDPLDPKNWLEDGQPAARIFDEETDLVLPAADTRYRVDVPSRANSKLAVRCVTVGENAGFRMNWGTTTGNVWVRPGGHIQIAKSTGGRHCFFRADGQQAPMGISGDYTISKTAGSSIEFLGQFSLGDRLFVKSGRMIIGPDSTFLPGSRDHRTPVYPEAELVLLSGATYGRSINQGLNTDITIAGALLAGLPERPLEKDCTMGLSYKLTGAGKGNSESLSAGSNRDDRSLVLLKGGAIRVHSGEPTSARLVFRWHGQADAKHDAALTAAQRAPHRISLVLLEDVQLDGVHFEDVEAKGIELANPANRATWRNVSFGQRNGGSVDDLVVAHPGGVAYKL